MKFKKTDKIIQDFTGEQKIDKYSVLERLRHYNRVIRRIDNMNMRQICVKFNYPSCK